MSFKYLAHTDGGARVSNPGEAAWAFVIYNEKKRIFSDGAYLGHASNNAAEYAAIISALQWADKNEASLHIKSDSLLAVNQLRGLWRVNTPSLERFHYTAYALLKLTNSTIEWVPRTENKEADEMYNQVLDIHMGKTK